jgi:hypothetical protein
VGKQIRSNKNYIDWGPGQSAFATGFWPAIALSKEGYVIEVHSDARFKSGSKQYYRVGKIDPNVEENQSISWKTDLPDARKKRRTYRWRCDLLSRWGNLLPRFVKPQISSAAADEIFGCRAAHGAALEETSI